MSPLEPGNDRAADRDDGGAREAEHDAESRVAGDLIRHVDALNHVTSCRTCLRTIYQVFYESMEQALRQSEPDPYDP